jgi:hypothetical protein
MLRKIGSIIGKLHVKAQPAINKIEEKMIDALDIAATELNELIEGYQEARKPTKCDKNTGEVHENQ